MRTQSSLAPIDTARPTLNVDVPASCIGRILGEIHFFNYLRMFIHGDLPIIFARHLLRHACARAQRTGIATCGAVALHGASSLCPAHGTLRTLCGFGLVVAL